MQLSCENKVTQVKLLQSNEATEDSTGCYKSKYKATPNT